MFFTIDDYNRHTVQEDYIDYIVGSMDFLEARTCLKEYMRKDKSELSNSDLEREIRSIAPSVLYDIFADEVVTTLEEDYYHA